MLEPIVDAGFDLSNAAFPYLAASELSVCAGVAARLFRVSFCGELGYEIAVPARYGDALFRRLLRTGAPLGAIPYGTEALGAMRIEKGFVAGGEINGQTTAGDLGLGKLLSTKKDYVGRVLAGREGLRDPARPVLVGLKPLDPNVKLRAGAHLAAVGKVGSTTVSEGFVTSAAHSPGLQSWIALGLLAHGTARLGERIRVLDPLQGVESPAEVCSPVLVDPEGVRVRS